MIVTLEFALQRRRSALAWYKIRVHTSGKKVYATLQRRRTSKGIAKRGATGGTLCCKKGAEVSE